MRQALGRGLDALLSNPAESKDGKKLQVQKLSVEKIRPNHVQTRKFFDPEKLSELAQSIKENGLAQPIIVTPDGASGTFELIAGERRLRASKLAGLTEIDAIIRPA